MSLVDRARIFATEAHGATGQKRKYTGEPYITHPEAVVAILKGVGIDDETTLAAAWLHDVLEDCPSIAAFQIDAYFGPEVEIIVRELTDMPPGRGLNRAQRKAEDQFRLAEASPRAQTIKCADLIDNTSSIVERDPEFARLYMAEKSALLRVIHDGNYVLWTMAAKIVDDYYGNNISPNFRVPLLPIWTDGIVSAWPMT